MNEYSMLHNDRSIPVDEEGFLLNTEDWNLDLAHRIAGDLELDMSEQHWEVVHYVRDYFEEHKSVPELRTFLKHLRGKYGKERATRRYVYQLFPYGYGQQACKIAGMRKPRKLMLDV